jgi:hypothetical protein
MTFTPPLNTDLLLSEAQKERLYTKLVEQLNKDFTLANESVDFPAEISPINLKVGLQDKVHRLIQLKFAEYLNLLYIIDVPEKEVKALDGSDLFELAEQVASYIKKRMAKGLV